MRSHSPTSTIVLVVAGLTLTGFFPIERHTSNVLAQEKDEVYVVGAGNAACRVWSEARTRKSAAATVFSSWVQGYVTGAADGQSAVHERIRTSALGGSIAAARNQYCRGHGEDGELCRVIALASRPREILAAVSTNEVESWLDTWCAAHPAETLYRAGQTLTGELDMLALETPK